VKALAVSQGVVVGARIVTCALALACATYSDKLREAHESIADGDLASGARHLNRVLDVHRNEDVPTKLDSERSLALLERGMVFHAAGMFGLSARDFGIADKQLELLDIARDGAGKIGQYIYSDSAAKYKTSPTEKLSLNAFNLLNYLVRGDLSGARVEAKRFTVMRNYLRDYDSEHAHGAFGSYMAGFVFERLGQADEALRYYDEALQERELASLAGPIAHLAQRGTYRSERLAAYVPPAITSPSASPAKDAATSQSDGIASSAELLVVISTGRVPFKIPRRIPIGVAVGLAGTYITGDPRVLEHSMFKVVVYPDLVAAQDVFDRATWSVDGREMPIELVTDLASELVAEYQRLVPKIIAAALTRMIVRAAAAEGARAAGRQSEGAGALIGFLAAAAVEGTLVALDRPDTRSWTTLPAQVHVGRIQVPPGHHDVNVELVGPRGRERRRFDVNVPPGGFAVLDVTTLR